MRGFGGEGSNKAEGDEEEREWAERVTEIHGVELRVKGWCKQPKLAAHGRIATIFWKFFPARKVALFFGTGESQ